MFEWSPATSEIGGYSVQFTATDDGDPPQSDSISVTVTVDPVSIPTDGDIIITEILYNPNGADDGLEWIEVYNNDSITIDIGGWRTCGANFSYDILPTDIVLAPGDATSPRQRS